MCELQNNIDALREQLAKQEAILEQQKREDERIMRKAREKEDTSWKHNIALFKSIFEPLQIQGEKGIAEFKKNGGDALLEPLKKNDGYGDFALNKKEEWERQNNIYMKKRKKHYDTQISRWRKPYEKDIALYHLLNRLDDRLTHIERFMTDDIKKEEFLENIPCTAAASNDCVQWASDGKAIPPPWYDK